MMSPKQTRGIREAAVAGLFYPADPATLRLSVEALLRAAKPVSFDPKALIAPHAGYAYSGPVAASAYQALAERVDEVRRVVLLGPSHRVGFTGVAIPSVDVFRTPLGDVPVDRAACAAVSALPQVREFDTAHAEEHSLEVHLPFLQTVLKNFSLIPIVVGEASPDEVAEVLETLWGGRETLVIVSTDLSHYLDYASAVNRDRRTADAIHRADGNAIGAQDACGAYPLRGLLAVAKRRGLGIRELEVRNSGDMAGGKDRVVGYGAWVLKE
jgi:AmmeMemoRadiSam system protein B